MKMENDSNEMNVEDDSNETDMDIDLHYTEAVKNDKDGHSIPIAENIEEKHFSDTEVAGDQGKDEESLEVFIEVEDDTRKAPDGGWGWMIVLGIMLIRTIVGKISVLFLHWFYTLYNC